MISWVKDTILWIVDRKMGTVVIIELWRTLRLQIVHSMIERVQKPES